MSLYQAAYTGLHAGDPDAVVMGVTCSTIPKTVTMLQDLEAMGIAKYLDGVSTHPYWNSPAYQSYTDGKVTLALTEIPSYVVSTNASVAKAGLTTPEGYDPIP